MTQETLAGVLAVGPLSLAAGLRSAGEIADELRDLHERSKAYGELTAASILLTESGAHLLPLSDYPDGAMPQREVEAFGAVLYQVLTGATAAATPTGVDLGVHGVAQGVDKNEAPVRAATVK